MRQETAVDGFRLAYERFGPGPGKPAVLMLHGWPGDRTDYREVAPPVSAVADVVVPDLRGFGESDKHQADPARQYNAAAQARSLIALIEELRLVRPVLVGYDIGSRIAQAIARPGAFAASIAWYRAGSGSVAASLAERAPEPDQRIAVPTTVLWPEYDPLFPREWSDRISEFFAAATLTWLDDVGHFSPVEAPDTYAAAITAALA
jgi:pimeloyl-ACP methyl ester carboxylesterase